MTRQAILRQLGVPPSDLRPIRSGSQAKGNLKEAQMHQVDEAVVRRMLQPRRATQIDSLAAALAALGVTLQVTVATELQAA